jgi:exodeoxyribonuclease VII small subunit
LEARTPRTDRASEAELGFEEALEQVESIIEKVESGQIGLEESIAQYERGAALILRCRKILERAEQRVQELTAQMSAPNSGGGASGRIAGADEVDAEPRG